MMAKLALLFVFGALVCQHMEKLPNLSYCILSIFFFSLFSIVPLFKKYALIFLALMLGLTWANLLATYRLSQELPQEWELKEIKLIGVVSKLPQNLTNGVRFDMDVEQVLTPKAKVPHHISLSQYQNQSQRLFKQKKLPSFHAGERWLLTVKLKRPHSTMNPHGFDFEAWAIERNVRATGSIKQSNENRRIAKKVYKPRYMFEIVRENIRSKMNETLQSRPYSGILQALVIGDQGAISQNDWQAFLNTGTNHLMSISGLHVTMLSGLAFSICYIFWRRYPKLTLHLPARKAALLVGGSVALLYALIAGLSIPTQRTVLMLMVFVIALWSGRQVVISYVLSYALFILILFDPWAVLSPGFWLSFGAVAIISYAFAGRIGKSGWLRSALISQWAVTLGLFPILIFIFQQVSIISPVANALAIPVISMCVVPLSLLGAILPFDGFLLLAHWVMTHTMSFLNYLALLPFSTWHQHAPPLWAFMLATTGILWMLLPKGMPLRFFGLFLCLPLVTTMPAKLDTGLMSATILDVGQGLAVVVRTKHHQLLYDAGPKYSEQSDSGTRIITPFLKGQGLERLDGFMVSHQDNDHSGGMASVLNHFKVDWLMSSFFIESSELEDVRHLNCYSGQYWNWDDVHFEILAPTSNSYQDQKMSDNNRSCVLKISSKYGSLLLTGDVERQAESMLVSQYELGLNSDVMVVPHHGSKTSSTIDFINAVRPKIAIFTSGYRNRFGHPKAEIEARYDNNNIRTYRTDYSGAVTLNFYQSGIEAKPWREYARRYWHDRF